jgi:hypothetical protein
MFCVSGISIESGGGTGRMRKVVCWPWRGTLGLSVREKTTVDMDTDTGMGVEVEVEVELEVDVEWGGRSTA